MFLSGISNTGRLSSLDLIMDYLNVYAIHQDGRGTYLWMSTDPSESNSQE